MKILMMLSILYLLFPLVVFLLTWINLWYGLPLSIGLGACLYEIFKKDSFTPLLESSNSMGISEPFTDDSTYFFSIKKILGVILLIFFWVFLSGIGGYMFQNFDHHWRNAILRDLIQYSWPVYYSDGKGEWFLLTYYIGYWIPSALIGKIFGWNVAKLVLFFWTCLGIFLTSIWVSVRTKISPIFFVLCIIFFSGMDFLGAYLHNRFSLWPPICHLEWWLHPFQLSSFTSQLFWSFNQSVPT